MIRLIEALNYRCLRYVKRPLAPFHVLVGPNASGKTTFLDVAGFLGDLLRYGLDRAIRERSTNIQDLFYCGQGDRLELAVELEIPEERVRLLQSDKAYRCARYEVSVGIAAPVEEYHILDEQVILQSRPSETTPLDKDMLFPNPRRPPGTIMHQGRVGFGKRRAVRKNYDANDNYYSEIETQKGKGGWAPSIRLGPRK